MRQRLLRIALAFALGSLVATQLFAFQQHYHPTLGTPVAQVGIYNLYLPTQGALWTYWWGWSHPQMFLTPGLVLLTITVGLALLHIQAPKKDDPPVREATRRDLQKAGLFAAHGVVLGTWHHRTLHYDGEAHTLVVAPSGGGKTQSIGIPTALTWRGSLFIHDPKNELFPASAAWRSTFSKVMRLDPTSPTSDY
jgi:type IV secretion system protein VirD4